MLSRRVRDDDGQLVLLVIFYTLIAAVLIVVAVDASVAFLARRDLSSVADGAALSAAQQVDRAAVYAGTDGGCGADARLPLAADRVPAAVSGYVDDSGVGARFEGVHIDNADVAGGVGVHVALTGRKHLPLLGLLGVFAPDYARGTVAISAAADAQSPLTC